MTEIILQNETDDFDYDGLLSGEVKPLVPPGTYRAMATQGKNVISSQKKTPGYKVTFKVIDGEYTGELFWCDIYKTAYNGEKRRKFFDKLQVTTAEQLKNFPQNMLFDIEVGIREYDGKETNHVTDFKYIETYIDPLEQLAIEARGLNG